MISITTRTIQEVEDQAVKDLQGNYHCAEAVFKGITEYFDAYNDDLRRMANAWGGGIGDSGHLCGGVSGAIMGISYVLAPKRPTKETWVTGDAASEFMELYIEKLKTISCNEIRRGLHWTESDPYCFEAMKLGIRLAIEIIEKHLKN